MRTSKGFQKFVTRLAEKHGLDLTAPVKPGELPAVKLANGSYMPLSIERIAPNLVTVSHTYVLNGDLMFDPEVVFFTGYDGWVPVEYTQDPYIRRQSYVKFSADGKTITHINKRMQADLTSFVNTWGRNLQAQRWMKNATIIDRS